MPLHPQMIADLTELVQAGGRLAQEMRGTGHEMKRDGSLVTAADRAVEEYLRDALPRLVTGTSVWGEEFGREEEGPAGIWIVDPIDGTSNYAFGSPLWGVSVALAKDGVLEAGCIVLPDIGEWVAATRGGGAYAEGRRLEAIPAGPVHDAELVGYCEYVARALGPDRIPGRMRCLGAFVIEGTFVARQRLRGMVGVGESLYDVAACILIAEELGADVRYADGCPLDLRPLLAGAPIGKPWIIFPGESGFVV